MSVCLSVWLSVCLLHCIYLSCSICFLIASLRWFFKWNFISTFFLFHSSIAITYHLFNYFSLKGAVECWLLAFEAATRDTLYHISKKAYQLYPAGPEGAIDRIEWLQSHPAQVRERVRKWFVSFLLAPVPVPVHFPSLHLLSLNLFPTFLWQFFLLSFSYNTQLHPLLLSLTHRLWYLSIKSYGQMTPQKLS